MNDDIRASEVIIERVLAPKRPGQRRFRFRCPLGHLHWSEKQAGYCAALDSGR